MSSVGHGATQPKFRMPVWGWILLFGLALSTALRFVHPEGLALGALEAIAGL